MVYFLRDKENPGPTLLLLLWRIAKKQDDDLSEYLITKFFTCTYISRDLALLYFYQKRRCIHSIR